jgi:mannose-6-phosphate isomerase-like protein (cupin superfamily)
MTVKADAEQTHGAYTFIEQRVPPAFAAPPHVHDDEDEAFYVLDGDLRVQCGAQTWDVHSNEFVYLPRNVAHAFAVTSETGAKLLQLTTPAGFEHFAREAGEPAAARRLPEPATPDVAKLLAAAEKHHKRML